MKGYYQPKGGKSGKYALRENTYRRTWYLIADYPYYKALEKGIIDAEQFSGAKKTAYGRQKIDLYDMEHHDLEQVREQGPGYSKRKNTSINGTFMRYIEAIEGASEQIPEAYIGSIMSHIIDRKKYKDMEGVDEKTLKVWTQRFIWHVADNLGDA